jgi:ArsR family transcriptional regulator
LGDSYLYYVPIMKALSDDTRLTIIDLLSCGEMCACHLLAEVEISQSTLSYHMKILLDSGLVNGEKIGAWVRYSLVRDKLDDTINFLNKLTTSKTECLYLNRITKDTLCHSH